MDIKAAAALHAKAALNKLVVLMNEGETQQMQLSACKEILDRAYGKACRAVTVDPGDEARNWLADLLKAMDGKSRGLPAARTQPATPLPASRA